MNRLSDALKPRPRRIISGGQTGVDRASLDVALALGLSVGGWCPKDRRAADGRIPDHYPLRETVDSDYETRTRRNVEEADGTLILNSGELDGGTALTAYHAQRIGKPCLVVDIATGIDPVTFHTWLETHQITVLNVAGPRENLRPGVYPAAYRLLDTLLRVTAHAAIAEDHP